MVAVFGCFVVLVTAIALMLPALSMTRGDLVCSLEEHAHSASCYEKVLVCGQEEGEGADPETGEGGHVHTKDCYEKKLVCEIPEHKHSDACYEQVEDEGEGSASGTASDGSAADSGDGSEGADGANDVGADGANDSDGGQAAGDGEPSGSASSVGAVEAGSGSDMPAQSFKADLKDAKGKVTLTVEVEAPEGAFPAGTFMKIDGVDASDIEGAVEKAVAKKADGKVTQIQAVDIAFHKGGAEGAEIEPARDITVKLTSALIAEAEKPLVVHVDDKGKADVVDTLAKKELKKRDLKAENDQLLFDSDKFSTYGIVVTTLEKTLVASDGKTYKVTVACPHEAGIPEDAELAVKEIIEDSEEHDEYAAKAESALGMEKGSAGYIRLFDIKIVDKHEQGVKYQPVEGATVDVSVELEDNKNDSLSVVHFVDGERAGTVVEGARVDGQVVNFEADGFSIYAIIGTDNNKRFVYNFYNGETPVATQYVKPIDSTVEENSWLYDPGITSEYGQIFLGWRIDDKGEIMDVDALNRDLAARFEGEYEDGTEINVYAAFTKAWYLRYLNQDNENNTTVLKTISVASDAPEAQRIFTIDYEVDLSDSELFEGWIALNGNVFQIGEKILLGEVPDGKTLMRDSAGRQYYLADPDAEDVEQDGIYPNRIYTNTEGHQDLYLKVQNRYWLVFVDNDTVTNDAGEEVSGGATYVPPQRIFNDGEGGAEDTLTAKPTDPTWRGYEFVGWNESSDGSGNWWLKYETEEVTDEVSGITYERVKDSLEVESQFGTTLNRDVTLYAIWTPSVTEYHVMYWQQAVTDTPGLTSDQKHYDYVSSATRYALTGEEVSTTNADRNMGGTTNSTFGYYFTYNGDNSDTSKHAAADGTTTLNVYYDRRTITINFTSNNGNFDATSTTNTGEADGETVTLYPDGNGGYYYIKDTSEDITVYPTRYSVSNNDNDNDPQKYRFNNGQMQAVYYRNRNWYTSSSGNSGWIYNSNFTRYIQANNGTIGVYNNQLVTLDANGAYTYTVTGTENVPYTGEVTTNTTTESVNSYTLTGLYGAPLIDWPSPGTNYAWRSGSTNGSFYLGKLTSFILPGSVNTGGNQVTWNLYRGTYDSSMTIHTRQMDVNGQYPDEDYDTSPISSSSTGITLNRAKYEGFDFDRYVWGSNSGTIPDGASSLYAPRPDNGYYYVTADMYAYYARHQAQIHYISTNDGTVTSDSDLIYYQAGLSDYGPGGSKYYEPTNAKEGYVFTGWYLDEACTIPFDFSKETMTDTGITLYAGWSYERVRVVLVPTPNNYDNDSVYFANNQALTFRMDYNEAVSDANINSSVAKRLGYKLIGWYTDPSFDNETEWTFSTQVNKYVTDGNGNQVVDMDYRHSDYWNQYGDNDGKHDDVVGILFLYAKWELDIDENALYVEYEVPDDYLVHNSLGDLQTTVPVDTLKYLVLTDEYDSRAIHIAEAPTGYAPGYNFTKWVVLNADGSESAERYSPGDTWELTGSNYEQFVTTKTFTDQNGDPILDDEGNPVTIQVLRIRADFDIQVDKSTAVTYDPNGGVGRQITETYFINEDFDMRDVSTYSREGYALVGWAFDEDADWRKFVDSAGEALPSTVPDVLNDDGTQLIGFTLGAHVAADNLNSSDTYQTVANTDENLVYAVWKPKTYTVTVVKRTESEDYQNEVFDFGAVMTPVSGESSQTEFKLVGNEIGATVDGVTYSSSETFEGVPYGTVFSVTENAPGYMPTVTYSCEGADDDAKNVSNESSLNGASLTVYGNMTVIFTNRPSTVGLEIVKIDQEGVPLVGASFSLVGGDVNETNLISAKADAEKATPAIVYVNHELPIGAYTLTETNPPNGYLPMEFPCRITVTQDSETGQMVVKAVFDDGSAEGTEVAPEYLIYDNESERWTLKIMNNAGVELPHTGGMGTLPLTLLGIMLIVGAAGFLVARRHPLTALSREWAYYNARRVMGRRVHEHKGFTRIVSSRKIGTVDPFGSKRKKR